jgi:hypothetical protein
LEDRVLATLEAGTGTGSVNVINDGAMFCITP